MRVRLFDRKEFLVQADYGRIVAYVSSDMPAVLRGCVRPSALGRPPRLTFLYRDYSTDLNRTVLVGLTLL